MPASAQVWQLPGRSWPRDARTAVLPPRTGVSCATPIASETGRCRPLTRFAADGLRRVSRFPGPAPALPTWPPAVAHPYPHSLPRLRACTRSGPRSPRFADHAYCGECARSAPGAAAPFRHPFPSHPDSAGGSHSSSGPEWRPAGPTRSCLAPFLKVWDRCRHTRSGEKGSRDPAEGAQSSRA